MKRQEISIMCRGGLLEVIENYKSNCQRKFPNMIILNTQRSLSPEENQYLKQEGIGVYTPKTLSTPPQYEDLAIKDNILARLGNNGKWEAFDKRGKQRKSLPQKIFRELNSKLKISPNIICLARKSLFRHLPVQREYYNPSILPK